MTLTIQYKDASGKVQWFQVEGSLLMIEHINEVERMQRLFSNQKYTQAEALRDKLAEGLDDLMRLGVTV